MKKYQVKYLVIGGIASVLYGVPRATFELDILIDATRKNAQKLLNALQNAGLGTAFMISADELLANEITVFQDRVRIDVKTRTPGITFKEAWLRREEMEFQGRVFYVVSKKDLIGSKKAASREIDLEDVRLLESNHID